MTDRPDEAGAGDRDDELARLRTQHSQVVQALQEAIRDTTRLTRLFAVLNESAPIEAMLDRVLLTLSELFMSDIVVLFDARTENELHPVASIGLPAGSSRRLVLSTSPYAMAALRTGTPVTVDRARDDAEVDAYLHALGVESLVWLRVCGDSGGCRGILVMARCRPLPFVGTDVDLIKTMAYRIGVMVERAHAEEERRDIELKLRQAEKTESLGRMAAAIAHNFNNMLAVVLGSLEIALDTLPEEHTIRTDLVSAREATTRAAKTSELMLAYLGQSVGNRAAIDLGKTVAEALPSLLATLPKHVRHTAAIPDDNLVISADGQQIIQLLSNLVINAGEAIGDGPGTIEITLRQIPQAQLPKPQFPMVDWQPKAASYACLDVSDNGRGMAPEVQEKAFDPFFTTKFVGRGLGLPVVLGTVGAYEGLITVESRRLLGTTVRVFLPLLPRVPPIKKIEKIQVTTTARPAQSRNLVLLAEDEENLRRATQRMLGRLGYEVVTAADGVEALLRFRQNLDDIGLAMIDLSMPRMDGWTTLKAMLQLGHVDLQLLGQGLELVLRVRDELVQRRIEQANGDGQTVTCFIIVMMCGSRNLDNARHVRGLARRRGPA